MLALTSALTAFRQFGKRRLNLLLAMLFLWACLVAFPHFPAGLQLGLDPSWMYGLNLAHVQKLAFGSQIAFTFGPLAYLGVPDPTLVSYASVAAFDLLVYVPLVYSLAAICKRIDKPIVSVLVLFIVVIDLQFKWSMAENLQVTFLCLILLLATRFSFRDTGPFLLAGFVAGVSLLVKANDGFTNVLLFYLVWTAAFMRSKANYLKPLIVAGVPGATVLCLFFYSQGSLAEIFPYFRNSLSAVEGYSAGMSLVGPAWQVWLGIGCILSTLCLAAIWGRSMSAYFAIGLAALLFLAAFKHAVVRQDAHVVGLHSDLAAICILFVLRAETRLRLIAFSCAASVNVVIALVSAHQELPDAFARTTNNLMLRNIAAEISAYRHLHRSWREVKESTESALASKRMSAETLAKIGRSSVQDMAWNVDLIRANHLNWNPCPVFQLYAAYTPLLDGLNAQHLEDSGADLSTVTWEALDQRHPFLDSPATWRAFLDKYELVQGDFDRFLLKRDDGHRLSPRERVGKQVETRWNEIVQLPQNSDKQMLIMYASVKKSIWGRIRQTLFRTDPIYLDVAYESGSKSKFRIIGANLSDGAIVSDLPRSVTELLPVLGYKKYRQDRVTSIRFIATDQSEFQDSITINWERMRLLDTNTSPAPLAYPDARSLIPLWLPGQPVASSSGVTISREPLALALRPTNLDPQIFLDTGQDLRPFKTIMVRAKFSVADQMDLYFGVQINGRSFSAYSASPDQWLDIYINTGTNPYWATDAGRVLRFDPSTGLSLNSLEEIAGIWGSREKLISGNSGLQPYLTVASSVGNEAELENPSVLSTH